MLIIDIETKPNKDLEKLYRETHDLTGKSEADIRKAMATDTDYCDIVMIGIKQVDGDVRVLNSIQELGTKQWNAWLSAMPLCTFNGKRFDIPAIIKQGRKHGVDLPYERLNNACKKWGYADRHRDLLEILSYKERWKSLDEYLQIYLGVEKKTKGPTFFETATMDELRQHCVDDLLLTEKLAKKFGLV